MFKILCVWNPQAADLLYIWVYIKQTPPEATDRFKTIYQLFFYGSLPISAMIKEVHIYIEKPAKRQVLCKCPLVVPYSSLMLYYGFTLYTADVLCYCRGITLPASDISLYEGNIGQLSSRVTHCTCIKTAAACCWEVEQNIRSQFLLGCHEGWRAATYSANKDLW